MYIVWNKKKDKLNFPTVIHETEDDAIMEAKRLAKKHIGDKFIVLSLDDGKEFTSEKIPLTRLGIIKKLKKLKKLCTRNDVSILAITSKIDEIIERSKIKNKKLNNEELVINGGIPLSNIISSINGKMLTLCPECNTLAVQTVATVSDGKWLSCTNCSYVSKLEG